MSGRGTGTKRKKTHIPSDFKRYRKAKVGKRATQQANLTDTSFKAVSVQVKGQSIASKSNLKGKHGEQNENHAGTLLLSSRGRSITDLVHQLHHPAGAVRVSAVRGIINLIQGTSFYVLEVYLSILLPVIAKCACVDDEQDVRTLGLSALHELIRKSNEHNNSVNANNLLWKPFVPLIVAFVTSALNSLDRATRLDGSRAVHIVSTLPLDRKAVCTILPAYITLLKDHGMYLGNGNGAFDNERATKKKNDKNHRLVILQSMVSLIRSFVRVTEETTTRKSHDLEHPDLSLHASCNNALVLLSFSHIHQLATPLLTLPSRDLNANGDAVSATGDKVPPAAECSDAKFADELFTKLRDVLVEATQRGSQGEAGLTMALADMEEVSLIVSSIHCLFKCFPWSESDQDRKNPIILHLVSIMLESMPIKPRSPDPQQQSQYETLNGNLCLAVIEMGPDQLKNAKWIDAILEYLLPTLDLQNMNQSAIAMNVLQGLLTLKNAQDKPALGQDTKDLILGRIAEVYFPVCEEALDSETMRSVGGRKAVQVVIDLVTQDEFKEETLNPLRIQMIQYVPQYIIAWKTDFPNESYHVLDLLSNIIRRTNFTNTDSSNVIQSLRQGIEGLFVATSNRRMSIFEEYADPMQRKTICLVVSFKSPTTTLLNALGKILAKAGTGTGISNDLADYILNVIHTTRTTMTMQVYLGFVFSSIGFTKCPQKSQTSSLPPNNEGGGGGSSSALSFFVRSRDLATLRVARILNSCGTSNKIIPMIAPMLCSWLDQSKGKDDLVRFRVVLLLLSMFSQHADDGNFLPQNPELRDALLRGVLNFFQKCSNERDEPELFSSFERPLLVRTMLAHIVLLHAFVHDFYDATYQLSFNRLCFKPNLSFSRN